LSKPVNWCSVSAANNDDGQLIICYFSVGVRSAKKVKNFTNNAGRRFGEYSVPGVGKKL
jgi:hypothetical protein